MNEAQTLRRDQRDAMVMAALPHVPFDGWSDACLRRAATDAGLGADAVVRLFPDGARGAVVHFMDMADRLMAADLATRDLTVLKIRERIATAVRVRLERWNPHREAIRRALALVPLPSMTGPALRGWYHTVDVIWREIGDRATDFSFYTKRMLLAGVYGATLLYWLDDRSEGAAATWAFLDLRIADVMRIPKVRARLAAQLKHVPRPSDLLRRLATGPSRGWSARTPRR
ncbi:MAG: COQ9 family protein [Rhodospirillaceae bacterium]|nr:MAG: COQ9 family protein [Rhodospirillaceae bacterium]